MKLSEKRRRLQDGPSKSRPLSPTTQKPAQCKKMKNFEAVKHGDKDNPSEITAGTKAKTVK